MLREITSDYWTPVGVWQIRENVRNAMRSKPEKFGSLGEVLVRLSEKLGNGRRWESQSELLGVLRSREVWKKYC